MDAHVLLTSHLATDVSACQLLPEVVRVLDSNPQILGPSPHQQKWVARVSSLLHSKEPSARWAGLTLALRTAQLCKPLMLERAQGWVALALPMLSKNEPPPNVKAAIRLLAHVLSAAIDVPEFTRLLATPTVPKFSAALLALAQRPDTPSELAILAICTITHLIPLYPTAHKSMHGALHALALQHTSGGVPPARREAGSALFAVLPHTGGKTGAAVLWRKAIDETLAFGWNSLRVLRTTYPFAGETRAVPNQEDPLVTVPLAIDRLECTAVVLKDLLQFTTARPVSLPVGPLVEFIQTILSCTTDGKVDSHVDAITRALEESAVPSIWAAGNSILADIACAAGGHLTAFVPRLLTILAFHLERPISSTQRIGFFTSVLILLEHAHALHHPLLPTRLTKATLVQITPLLRPQSEDTPTAAIMNGAEGAGKSRKGKKRARDYEGDEVFKVGGGVVLPTVADGNAALIALDVLRVLMRNAYVAPTTSSLASRILLALQLSLPALPASQLNPELSLHPRLLSKVQATVFENAAGTSSVLGKSLPLALHSAQLSPSEHREVELLLHPRVPPLVRALPHVEALALFRAEEGDEEADIRKQLGVAVVDEPMISPTATPVKIATPLLVAPKPSAPIATPLLVAQANEVSASLSSTTSSALFGKIPAPTAPQPTFAAPTAVPASTNRVTATAQPITPAPSLAPGVPQPGPAPPTTPPNSIPRTFGYRAMSQEEDEDEPMPSINVDSDSDEDDD
ncbi:unnamed protein product [Peniophora sp. CBMAI 1063]|nr:unnamed protein product [Peniophora sp. CBMAI 1063]